MRPDTTNNNLITQKSNGEKYTLRRMWSSNFQMGQYSTLKKKKFHPKQGNTSIRMLVVTERERNRDGFRRTGFKRTEGDDGYCI